MRYVYCARCQRVSTNVWREHDLCMHCGGPAELLPNRAPWHSYAGSAVLLAAAAILLFGPFTDLAARAAIVIAAIVAGAAVSSWSLSSARAHVARDLRTKGFTVRERP